MQNDYIDLIQTTPVMQTKKCRFIAMLIKLFLQYTPVISAFIAWYLYDYFIAGATLLIMFIIVGIVRAKMRNSVIPLSQREYHYNDEGIANWFTAKEICPQTNDTTITTLNES
ncbi:hypothetical protein [Sulfurimonas sp.]